MPKADDAFYVIGYTNEQVVEGGIRRIMSLDTHLMNTLNAMFQKFGVLQAAAANGFVVEEIVEIYTAMHLPGNPCGDLFELVFLNDVALRMCRLNNVRLPAVLKKITRSEVPSVRRTLDDEEDLHAKRRRKRSTPKDTRISRWRLRSPPSQTGRDGNYRGCEVGR